MKPDDQLLVTLSVAEGEIIRLSKELQELSQALDASALELAETHKPFANIIELRREAEKRAEEKTVA